MRLFFLNKLKYSLINLKINQMSTIITNEIKFGPWNLHPSQIFYESTYSYGIVNLKPIVPGHVLIISKRVCQRMKDLNINEVNDLFLSVYKISPIIEKYYHGDSLNIAIQDGTSAGQTVPHIHVHILPRKAGDFQRSDEVHERLEEHDATIDFTKPRLPRSLEDMAQESTILRQLIEQEYPNNSEIINEKLK